jgi:hypothetical protein
MILSAPFLLDTLRRAFAAFQPHVLLFCAAISGRDNRETA